MARFVILSFLFLCSADVLSQEIDTLKCWLYDRKITWADFKGGIPLGERLAPTRAACTYDIRLSHSRDKGILHYKVRVFFYRNKSWTRDSTKYGLAHEQLHFDIAELYGRKLRSAINEIGTKPDSDYHDFDPIIEGILSEMTDRQREYDFETNYGTDKAAQQKFTRKIYEELESLKLFESSLEDCI